MPSDPIAQEFTESMDTASKHILSPAGGKVTGQMAKTQTVAEWAVQNAGWLVTRDEYVEQLERALMGLRGALELEMGSDQCSLCGEWVEDEGHAHDCVVPALQAKYADDD